MKSAADVAASASSGQAWLSTLELVEELGARAIAAGSVAAGSDDALALFRREVFEFTDMVRQADDLLFVYPPLVDRLAYAEFVDGWIAAVTAAARSVAEGLVAA